MKQLKLLIFTLTICFSALFLFVFFRTVPVSRIWKGYQVLYVTSKSLTEPQVVSLLEQNGCKNVVSKSTQRIPIVSKFSPVQVQDAMSYLTVRNHFFTDESDSAMVFYIPDGQDTALARAVREITGVSNTTAGTDGTASFPWLSPIISLVFALLCVFFAKKKIFLIPTTVFLVLFSFSRPLLTTSAAVCLALYGFFMLQKIWGRRNFSSAVVSPLIVVCVLVPVLLLFMSSPLSALFYTLAISASFSAVLLVDLLKNVYDERHVQSRFKPVLIRSARFIPLVEKKELKIILGLFLAIIAILGVSFAGSSLQNMSLDSSRPALPAPVSGKSDLPDMDDFMTWSWNTITFPYRRMTDAKPQVPVDGDKGSIPGFNDAGGKIAPSEQTAFVYNAAFRNSVYDSVKDLPYPALEKMMLKQGKDARYSYTKGGGAAAERWGTSILLLFMLIPLGILLYFVLIKRSYGISL